MECLETKIEQSWKPKPSHDGECLLGHQWDPSGLCLRWCFHCGIYDETEGTEASDFILKLSQAERTSRDSFLTNLKSIPPTLCMLSFIYLFFKELVRRKLKSLNKNGRERNRKENSLQM